MLRLIVDNQDLNRLTASGTPPGLRQNLLEGKTVSVAPDGLVAYGQIALKQRTVFF